MFYKYVESNRSNTRDRIKPSQVQDQPLFLQCSPLFLRASVSSLLNKKSIDGQINFISQIARVNFLFCLVFLANFMAYR